MSISFSIIVPTYNRGYILWKTIQSIQEQSWPYWELLIIDDGSTDETKKVIREFQKDPRILYFYKENGGSSSARNLGLEKASKDIVTYVDSDDRLFSHYLLLAQEQFFEYPEKTFAIVNGNFKIETYDSEGFVQKSEQIGLIYPRNPTLQNFYNWEMRVVGGTGCFHRRETFQKIVEWKNLSPVEDLEFLMQLAQADPNGFMYIPQVCYEYKQRYGKDGVYANAKSDEWENAIKQILSYHKNDPLMLHPELYLKNFSEYRNLFIKKSTQ